MTQNEDNMKVAQNNSFLAGYLDFRILLFIYKDCDCV